MDETKKRVAFEMESQAVIDQLQILRECFKSSKKHREKMNKYSALQVPAFSSVSQGHQQFGGI